MKRRYSLVTDLFREARCLAWAREDVRWALRMEAGPADRLGDALARVRFWRAEWRRVLRLTTVQNF